MVVVSAEGGLAKYPKWTIESLSDTVYRNFLILLESITFTFLCPTLLVAVAAASFGDSVQSQTPTDDQPPKLNQLLLLLSALSSHPAQSTAVAAAVGHIICLSFDAELTSSPSER